MPLVALAVLMGALLAFYGNQLPDPFWASFAPLLLLLARFNLRYRFVALLFAAILWSGAVLQSELSYRLVDDFDNRRLLLIGTVADIPQVHQGRVSLLLDNLEIQNYPSTLPRRVRLNWYQVEQIPLAGERWQLNVRIRQPRGLLNPVGFDFERWLFVEGIDASGYVLFARDNRRLQAASAISLNGWRSQLADRIDRDCTQCLNSGLIKALALGLRGDVDPQARELLQASGTAHLLAISGLHVGMVALLGYLIGRCIWRFGGYRLALNRRQLASVCALLMAAVYAGLAGFSLPTLRALLMLIVVLLGHQFNRKVDLLQATSIALLLILIVDPIAVGSSSFWLSFGALLVIAFAAFRQPEVSARWQQLLSTQVFFTLLFLPVSLLIFGQVNPASLPANLFSIPFVSFLILPTVLLASLLSALDFGLASLVLGLADDTLGFLLSLLDWLLASGLQSRYPTATPPLLILCLLATMLLLLLPRWSSLPAVALAMLIALFGWQPSVPEHGEFEMTVFDVGMGSSVLLRTRHHSLLYDLGPGRRGHYNAGERILLPLLRQLDVEQPDLIIISHVDQDHSGGFFGFEHGYEPARLLSGTPAELRRRFGLPHRVRNCHEHAGWRWDGVDFRFLPVQTRPSMNTNNRSCILLVSGYHRVLLPGDIEQEQEEYLVTNYGDMLAADVLLAPHHGSKTSSSEAFVSQVNPSKVVFTLSRNNRWGFPHATVEARYRNPGIQLLRSDSDGAILFASRKHGLSVTSLRNPPRRLWQRW